MFVVYIFAYTGKRQKASIKALGLLTLWIVGATSDHPVLSTLNTGGPLFPNSLHNPNPSVPPTPSPSCPFMLIYRKERVWLQPFSPQDIVSSHRDQLQMLLVPFHATAPQFSQSSNYDLGNKINQSLQTKSYNNLIMWTQQNWLEAT